MTKFVIGSAACLLLPLLAACAGTGTPTPLPSGRAYLVSGVVTDQAGDPLRFASVGLVGSPLGAITNASGEFKVSPVGRGAYAMTVIYLGFKSNSVSVLVPGDGQSNLSLDMVRDPRFGTALNDSLPPIQLSYEIASTP